MTRALSTIDWNAVKVAIRAFVGACNVVDPGALIDGVSNPLANIVWEREANPITYGDLIELRISGETTVGTDDVEDVEVEPGTFIPRITAHAEFVVSIRYNSRSQQTAARSALSVVRASFHHPGRLAILEDAGLGFLTTESLVTMDAVSDDRWQSVGVLDVRLSVTSELFEPETDAPIGYLTSVGVSVNGSPEETMVP